ncbi:hypothetical protein ZTR_10964 [Talaromyces verruculosus]|nr:hypothetical protein ZTR_10964 [Talaromyces verruculosus]
MSTEPQSPPSSQEFSPSESPADVRPAAETGSQNATNVPIDSTLIDSLLQQLLSSSRKLGVFGVLPSSLQANNDIRPVLNIELQHALLAIALELFRYRLPEPVADSFNLSRDHFQMSALALTPTLTWKNHQLQLGSVLVLLLFSYTWCLSEEFAGISVRWYSLSRVILQDVSKTRSQSNDWDELARRTEMSLYIHDACMRAVIEAPVFGSRAWNAAKNDLCYYFFRFPPSLLRFDDLTYAYEAEAMVWMHGLFILLYGTRDLVDLIMNPSVYHEASRFSYLLEHSLLLGDVLPTILSLDPYLESISPATIIFLLHSTIVHAIALRQFFSDNSNQASLESAVPAKLLRSSDHHHSLLSAITTHCKRYDIPIIEEIHTLLLGCLARTAFRNMDARMISAQQLICYRWGGTGTGIIPLQRDEAVAAWQYSASPSEEIWRDLPDNTDELRLLIENMCAPNMRICRNGYFDLSILIR